MIKIRSCLVVDWAMLGSFVRNIQFKQLVVYVTFFILPLKIFNTREQCRDTQQMSTPKPSPEATPESCKSLLTSGSWKNFQINENPEYNKTATIFHHIPKNFNLPNAYKQNSTFSFTYSGEIGWQIGWQIRGRSVNDDCKIHRYKTSEIKKCFDDYHEIVIFGDSRSRVLYRVLQGRYDGVNKVTDYKDHHHITSPPFVFYWSVDFEATVKTLYKNHLLNVTSNEEMLRNRGRRLVILGEQYPRLECF